MLRNYVCTIDLWGGDKIIKETVTANDPNKASQRARDLAHKKTKTPYPMIKVINVEIAK